MKKACIANLEKERLLERNGARQVHWLNRRQRQQFNPQSGTNSLQCFCSVSFAQGHLDNRGSLKAKNTSLKKAVRELLSCQKISVVVFVNVWLRSSVFPKKKKLHLAQLLLQHNTTRCYDEPITWEMVDSVPLQRERCFSSVYITIMLCFVSAKSSGTSWILFHYLPGTLHNTANVINWTGIWSNFNFDPLVALLDIKVSGSANELKSIVWTVSLYHVLCHSI